MRTVLTTETLKISIRALIKNPEMLKFFPDYLKTKKMCKNTVEKLSSDKCKTQEMSDNVI